MGSVGFFIIIYNRVHAVKEFVSRISNLAVCRLTVPSCVALVLFTFLLLRMLLSGILRQPGTSTFFSPSTFFSRSFGIRHSAVHVPPSYSDPNWGMKVANKELRKAYWAERSKFPIGFRTQFVQRRFVKPSLLRHVLVERKQYMLKNMDRWALLDAVVAERDKEKRSRL